MLGPLARFGAEHGIEGVAFVAWRALLGVLFVGTLLVARRGVGESMAAIEVPVSPRTPGARSSRRAWASP